MYFLHVYGRGEMAPVVERARNRTEILLSVSRLLSRQSRPERIIFFRDARPLFLIDGKGVRRIGPPRAL
jgi:hypothetical protein